MSFTNGDMVYHNGLQVEFEAEVDDRQSLIGINLSSPDGEWFGHSHVVVATSSLMAECPDPFADLKAQRLEMVRDINQMRAEKRQMEKDRESLDKKIAQHDALKHIFDYIDGKITHFVETAYDSAGIIAFEDFKASPRDRDIRLLSLFGRSKGDLFWKANQYYDGSGSGWHYIIPCLSYEDAQTALRTVTEKLISEHDGNYFSPRMDKACLEHNVTSPAIEAARVAMADREDKKKADSIAELKSKLAEALNAGGAA